MSHETLSISLRICGHLVVYRLVRPMRSVCNPLSIIQERVALSYTGLQLLTQVFAISILDA